MEDAILNFIYQSETSIEMVTRIWFLAVVVVALFVVWLKD